jgi:hypothetical protein
MRLMPGGASFRAARTRLIGKIHCSGFAYLFLRNPHWNVFARSILPGSSSSVDCPESDNNQRYLE